MNQIKISIFTLLVFFSQVSSANPSSEIEELYDEFKDALSSYNEANARKNVLWDQYRKEECPRNKHTLKSDCSERQFERASKNSGRDRAINDQVEVCGAILLRLRSGDTLSNRAVTRLDSNCPIDQFRDDFQKFID